MQRLPSLDRAAIGLSGLCVLHCLLSVILVAAMSGAAAFMTDSIVHKYGLIAATLLGAAALYQGYTRHRATRPALVGGAGVALMALALVGPHGIAEVVLTVAGVTVLAAGHLLNARTSA